MASLKKIKISLTGKPVLYDVIFLVGIFAFSALLILGLFPRNDTVQGAGRSFFLYAMMAVPVIVAIYIIVISFRRKLALPGSRTLFSIRVKIALAFVFVAILPSLPIILISNNIISHMISELITEKTANALDESIRMSRESISQKYEDVRSELTSLQYALNSGMMGIDSSAGRKNAEKFYGNKGYGTIFYYVVQSSGNFNSLAPLDDYRKDVLAADIGSFLGAARIPYGVGVYNISAGPQSLILGTLRTGTGLVALYYKLPEKVYSRISMFEESLGRYREREYMKSYLQTGVGIFLLLLAIFIVMISIAASLLLSKNITRPVLELEEAARRVADGDFTMALHRDSPDELALLFDSFNTMIRQLEESRRVMFHTQKLEAWREVARKLVHEIKNPLTPIRLSAERMQQRFKENHPDIGTIVLTGTETIIEEVNVLMSILGEFSRFARLPEMKPEFGDLNPNIESCVNFFHGHERVVFHLDLDASLPKVYFDKILLRQALTNILQNSIDAIADKGDIYIRTSLAGGGAGARAVISIRDDGSGIPPEDMAKIFEPTFSTKPHGTGIGLVIVEKIVLEHKGRITCSSVPGEGTEFVIELPATLQPGSSDGKNTDS